MVDVDRMIGRLGELVQNPYVASRDGCCRKNRSAKQFSAHGLRTTERKENPSRAYLMKSRCIESFITLSGVAQYLMMFGESGWVEDNQIVAVHGGLFQNIQRKLPTPVPHLEMPQILQP